MSLENKVIIITGASKGLGRETAIEAARSGAAVAICSRNAYEIKKVADELSRYSKQVLAVEADVSNEKAVKKFVAETFERFGAIDVLINNAAVFENYQIADSTLESWQTQFDNNVTSVFLMIRECLPIMRKQKKGRIISLTTGLARLGASGFGAYSASKAALETLTFSVEEEEYSNGISAAVFNPGVMKTKMQSQGDDPKEVAPILLNLASSSNQGQGKVVRVDDWKAND
ncbi:SDR family NAD(P)-dependent oxidoreductase [Halalkalibacterium ligniniphilum]|uniref:SDR family NAD(P)-dependent oxidoreductase n=1 Tax=Halalkalibacterium ligniniphilum TaxID=1134413 RepID=UPI00036A88C1|nr:SDR family oxidoreductase [Halalkalibacterium ligniniphilum]